MVYDSLVNPVTVNCDVCRLAFVLDLDRATMNQLAICLGHRLFH